METETNKTRGIVSWTILEVIGKGYIFDMETHFQAYSKIDESEIYIIKKHKFIGFT